jgi:hypothetical protein
MTPDMHVNFVIKFLGHSPTDLMDLAYSVQTEFFSAADWFKLAIAGRIFMRAGTAACTCCNHSASETF